MKCVVLSGITRRSGGVFYAVSSLCKELYSLGVNVSVMGNGCGLGGEDRAVWNTVDLVPYKAIGPLSSAIGLRRKIVAADADLVHQHGLWLDDQWASKQWQKKSGHPVVISPHGMLDPWALRNSAWKKKLVGALFANRSLQKATCLHALCQSEADSIRSYGLDNPIVVIPNGVQLPEIGRVHSEARGRSGKLRLLFLGRIHPKKGLRELIGAWGGGHGTWRKESQLLIAGWDDGGHLTSLKLYAEELGLKWGEGMSAANVESNSLVFLGAVFGRDKESLMRTVDGFILPSFSEGLPMSVLEAWSYGLPVIMTEGCNLPEGFEANAAVHISPTMKSIAEGIQEWFQMGITERKSMGERGRLLVEQRFAWNKIAQDMKSVYEDCVAGNRTPS